MKSIKQKMINNNSDIELSNMENIEVKSEYIVNECHRTNYDIDSPKILKIHVQSGEWQVLLADATFNDSQQNAVIRPQSICFKTLDNAHAYGFFYAAKKKNESF